MKRLKTLYWTLKVFLGYRLKVKAERLISSVALSMLKSGQGEAAFMFSVQHHASMIKAHQEALAGILKPLAERPRVSTQNGVEIIDWTETPTSKAMVQTAVPSVMTKAQAERLH
jgi:uncharacterized protein YegP (UPF0339 family)